VEIDSVFVNVPDVDAALDHIRFRLGLKAFLKFDLIEADGVEIPIAIVMIGNNSLEIIGRVEGNRPEAGVISQVEINAPVNDKVCFALTPGAELICYPSSKPGIRSIEILTTMPGEDEAALVEFSGGVGKQSGDALEIGEVSIHLVTVEADRPAENPGLAFPGWHRLSVKVSSAVEFYNRLTESGLLPLKKPFQVMPGLKEAMVYTPSGLILQVTEERLVRMMPVMAWHWARSRLSGRPMSFRTKYVGD